jgi:hypothetical protein
MQWEGGRPAVTFKCHAVLPLRIMAVVALCPRAQFLPGPQACPKGELGSGRARFVRASSAGFPGEDGKVGVQGGTVEAGELSSFASALGPWTVARYQWRIPAGHDDDGHGHGRV